MDAAIIELEVDILHAQACLQRVLERGFWKDDYDLRFFEQAISLTKRMTVQVSTIKDSESHTDSEYITTRMLECIEFITTEINSIIEGTRTKDNNSITRTKTASLKSLMELFQLESMLKQQQSMKQVLSILEKISDSLKNPNQ
jgi:hypothetical protein